jgi:hypothetical protein
MPFSAVRLFIYNTAIYFMTGLHRSAGAFWTFHLIGYTTFLTLQGFFRTFGLCFQNFDTALRMSVIFVPSIIQYSGYLIPEFLMKRWLFWMYYINPFTYSWAAIMESEFSRISLVCEGSFVVPRNGPGMDKYPNIVGPNQACTLYGAQPGATTISGSDYLKAAYLLDVNDLWRRNFPVIVGWFFFFLIAQIVVIEYLQVCYPHVLVVRTCNRTLFARARPSMLSASLYSQRRRRRLQSSMELSGRGRRSPRASKRRSLTQKRNLPSQTTGPSLGNVSIIPFPSLAELDDSFTKFTVTSGPGH